MSFFRIGPSEQEARAPVPHRKDGEKGNLRIIKIYKKLLRKTSLSLKMSSAHALVSESPDSYNPVKINDLAQTCKQIQQLGIKIS